MAIKGVALLLFLCSICALPLSAQHQSTDDGSEIPKPSIQTGLNGTVTVSPTSLPSSVPHEQDVVGMAFQQMRDLNQTAGFKADFATRNRFRDAVCDQVGLTDCDSDLLTFLFALFYERELYMEDLSDRGIGGLSVFGGFMVTRSGVGFRQDYAYGTASPSPYNQSGRVNITTAELYGKVGTTFNPAPGWDKPILLSPFFRFGLGHFWNKGEFDFDDPDAEPIEYTRRHNGLAISGGIGTDIFLGGPLGGRVNLDYMNGGADAHTRFGAGLIYKF